MPESSAVLNAAVDLLRSAKRVAVVTGAGISRESGIPTFRDARDGLWARYDPRQLATRDAFRSEPGRVWAWYCYRRRLVADAEPHAGHRALVRLEDRIPEVAIITQNIDGLHQRAGSSHVVELHSNINRFKCFERDHPVALDASAHLGAEATAEASVSPPRCPTCGSPVRPDVVWFGEPLGNAVIEEASALARRCDVMLIVGTSGVVYPAAALPGLAQERGAKVIEVNTAPSELSARADVFLEAPAGDVLPLLVDGAMGPDDGPVS